MGIEDKDLAVWFTPDAIRQHLEGEPKFEAILEKVTDDRLREVMEDHMDRDDLWELFDRILRDVVEELETETP